jgi:4-hydroxybenzoate polyprenyltransferase
MHAFKRILVFYRVKEWVHMLGLVVLGYAYSQHSAGLLKLGATLAVGSFCLASGYSINDIYDHQVKIKISHRSAMQLSLTALILSLVISWFISVPVFFITAIGHLSGMLYSARPFRFKNKLWLDLIFNSLPLANLFLIGYLPYSPLTIKPLAIFTLFLLYFLPIQLIHEIQDQKIDQSQGQRNTFQVMGMTKTKLLIQASLIFYMLLSLFFWKSQILSPGATLANLIFMATTIYYIGSFRDLPPKNIKLDVRRFSALYGMTLLIVFYYKI